MLTVFVLLLIITSFFIIKISRAIGVGLCVILLLLIFRVLPTIGTATNPVPHFPATVKLVGIPTINYDDYEVDANHLMAHFISAEVHIQSTYQQEHNVTLACWKNNPHNKPFIVNTVKLLPAHVYMHDSGFGSYTIEPSETVLSIHVEKGNWSFAADESDVHVIGCKLVNVFTLSH